MKIAVYAKSVKDRKHEEIFHSLINHLQDACHEVYCPHNLIDYIHINLESGIELHPFNYCDKENKLFDAMVCVGGDGTLLDTLSLLRDSEIPVLGINTGRLGFLAALSEIGLKKAISDLQKGNYSIEDRTMLQFESSDKLFDYPIALNDFVLHKKETSSMIVVHTFLNGEFLNSYWADGLIVSTPTGSTGYSLSCGGPIIFPRSENFVITPIAPHNLNVRPVVVKDDYVISFEIEGRASSYLASLDSRSVTVASHTQMAVRKSDFNLKLIRPEGDQYLDTLRNKLNWGFDKRN